MSIRRVNAMDRSYFPRRTSGKIAFLSQRESVQTNWNWSATSRPFPPQQKNFKYTHDLITAEETKHGWRIAALHLMILKPMLARQILRRSNLSEQTGYASQTPELRESFMAELVPPGR